MNVALGGLAGALSVLAFFGFLAFVSWLDYRKKKDERDARHQERMKALELGHPPRDAEIERARAYASAAWAAGLIGLVVPIVVVALAVAGTVIAVLYREDSIGGPLIAAWSITCVIVLVAILRSLSVIRQLPRPTQDAPAAQAPVRDKSPEAALGAFQEKRLGL